VLNLEAPAGVLGVTEIEEHIKFEVRYTSIAWRNRYNPVQGSTQGLAHDLTHMAYFRLPNLHLGCQN
jgi:hypothetical protein